MWWNEDLQSAQYDGVSFGVQVGPAVRPGGPCVPRGRIERRHSWNAMIDLERYKPRKSTLPRLPCSNCNTTERKRTSQHTPDPPRRTCREALREIKTCRTKTCEPFQSRGENPGNQTHLNTSWAYIEQFRLAIDTCRPCVAE